MKNLKQFLSSGVTTLILLAVYAVGLGVATFLEKYYGTAFAKHNIYYSPVFFFLQCLLLVNFVAVAVKNESVKNKRWGFLLTHFSFIVILGGALVTHLFAEEGIVHIREGEQSNQLMIQQGETSDATSFSVKTLPFSIELLDFRVERYPGSHSPSAYESDLRVHADGKTVDAKVYMNNVLDFGGYRFFQASFDKDEKGTVLSLNKDVYGRNITYAGYLLLVIGFSVCFLGKDGRFRELNRKLKELRNMSCVLLGALLSILLVPEAKANSDATVQDVQVKKEIPAVGYHFDAGLVQKFAALPVQSPNGRIVPIDTFSSELLRKLTGEKKMGDLTANEFLLSLISFPELWAEVRLMPVANAELKTYLKLENGSASYADFFDATANYKLEGFVASAYEKMPKDRTAFDKDVLKLDERVNIFYQLTHFQLLRFFPKEKDSGKTWYASGDNLVGFEQKDAVFVSRIMPWFVQELREAANTDVWTRADEVLDMIATYQGAKDDAKLINADKIKAEMLYNKYPIFSICQKSYLIFGGLALLLGFFTSVKSSMALRVIRGILLIPVFLGFAIHLSGIILRWNIAGYAPFSNAYETMIYVSWITVLAGWIFVRRSFVTFALATILGGVILFVSGLNWMDPQITPLVPVLKSAWLMFHVAVIVAAYGFFGISFLLGVSNLVLFIVAGIRGKTMLPSRIQELSIVNEMALFVGVALMSIGTLLGAVWANESWGRYWGWDPKETWALITIVVYVMVTHSRFVKKLNNPWVINCGSVVGFASVLMTYFGVNYFLSGMHSYGGSSEVHRVFNYLYIAAGIVLLLSLASFFSYKKIKNPNQKLL